MSEGMFTGACRKVHHAVTHTKCIDNISTTYLEACKCHLQGHGRVVADANDIHDLKQPPQCWQVVLRPDGVLVVTVGLRVLTQRLQNRVSRELRNKQECRAVGRGWECVQIIQTGTTQSEETTPVPCCRQHCTTLVLKACIGSCIGPQNKL